MISTIIYLLFIIIIIIIIIIILRVYSFINYQNHLIYIFFPHAYKFNINNKNLALEIFIINNKFYLVIFFWKKAYQKKN